MPNMAIKNVGEALLINYGINKIFKLIITLVTLLNFQLGVGQSQMPHLLKTGKSEFLKRL